MKKSQINDEIRRCYPIADNIVLASRLGVTLNNLRGKSARIHVRKILAIVTNEIINRMKLCPKFCKIKDVNHFNKDKYQPNKLDYWCR